MAERCGRMPWHRRRRREMVRINASRYDGLAGLSGGLIGPDDTPRDYAGSLAGTPVFLGCSDVDSHIPKQRIELTTRVRSAAPSRRGSIRGWDTRSSTTRSNRSSR